MANPFFTALNANVANSSMQSGPNIFQMAQQLKANPLLFILQRKLNIPTNLMNDPNAMLNYLVGTKQIPQTQVDWAKQQLIQMGRG